MRVRRARERTACGWVAGGAVSSSESRVAGVVATISRDGARDRTVEGAKHAMVESARERTVCGLVAAGALSSSESRAGGAVAAISREGARDPTVPESWLCAHSPRHGSPHSGKDPQKLHFLSSVWLIAHQPLLGTFVTRGLSCSQNRGESNGIWIVAVRNVSAVIQPDFYILYLFLPNLEVPAARITK